MVLFRVWEACFLGVGVCFGFSLRGGGLRLVLVCLCVDWYNICSWALWFALIVIWILTSMVICSRLLVLWLVLAMVLGVLCFCLVSLIAVVADLNCCC